MYILNILSLIVVPLLKIIYDKLSSLFDWSLSNSGKKKVVSVFFVIAAFISTLVCVDVKIDSASLFFGVLYCVIGCIFVFAVWNRYRFVDEKNTFFDSWQLRYIAIGVAFIFCLSALGYTASSGVNTFKIIYIIDAFIASIYEELFFRYLFFDYLYYIVLTKNKYPKNKGVYCFLISTFVFVFIHLLLGKSAIANYLLISVICFGLRFLFRHPVFPILYHAFHNYMAYTMFV
jgi:membrane protease YdiL (CAAX protease family)